MTKAKSKQGARDYHVVSMTGHGSATSSGDDLSVSIELRAVNNRYLKTSIRMSESDSSLEPRIEEQIKKRIRRGSVHVSVKLTQSNEASAYRINEEVVRSYYEQLSQVFPDLANNGFHPEAILELPGAIDTGEVDVDSDALWQSVSATLATALDRMDQMRHVEGATMAQDMADNCECIRRELTEVESQAGNAVERYQERLSDRIQAILESYDVKLEGHEIAKEVGMFADRCDISEEIVRLKSHLDQFQEFMSHDVSEGKKLDFLTQEMFREINTIGSKANDASIAHHVIEMKAAVERIREMTQNIE